MSSSVAIPWRLVSLAIKRDNVIPPSNYYGPYNMILSAYFPLDEGYLISPEMRPAENPFNHELIMTFAVRYLLKDVFFVTVHDPTCIDRETERAHADQHLRQCLLDVAKDSTEPLKKVLGFNCMGTLFAIYSLPLPVCETDPVEPHRIADDDRYNERTSESWWGFDILSAAGRNKFQEVVEEVKRTVKEAYGEFDPDSPDVE